MKNTITVEHQTVVANEIQLQRAKARTKMIRFKQYIAEKGDDAKGHFIPTEKGAGMTPKGVKAYRAKNPGSKLKTAVTGKVKAGSKDAGRRKSFCARSKGWTGERGKAARRRWKC